MQTDNHTSTPPLFFTGWMPFLPPNQQRQSTEGKFVITPTCPLLTTANRYPPLKKIAKLKFARANQSQCLITLKRLELASSNIYWM